MSWNGELSSGSLMQISRGDSTLKPVVQVTDLRRVPQNGTDRFRLQVSDGSHYFSGMLASQMNPQAVSGELQKLCIIQMKDFIMNVVQDKSAFKAADPTATMPASTYQPQRVPNENATGAANTGGFGNTNLNAPGNRQKWNSEPWKPAGSTAISKVDSGHAGLSGKINYFPIMSVNPYQNRWTIRGRITNKGPLRKYTNPRGEGVVLSFEISDDSGSIKVACFREVAERMSEMIQMGKTYSISKAIIKQADKRFNRCSSDYEMMLGNESEVELVPDDGSIAQVKYNFVKVAELEKKTPGTFLDMIGIVQEVHEIVELTSKSTGEPLFKRTVAILDDSGKSVNLTLWGEVAQNFAGSADSAPVILCKGIKRGDYQGVSLDAMRSSFIELNPDIPEAHALKGWYDAEGHGVKATVVGGMGGGLAGDRERKTLAEVGESNVELANDPRGLYFTTRATLTMINGERGLWYTACPETKKKVTEIAPGRWHCAATDKDYDHCDYRYILNISFQDESSNQWMSAFDECGEVIVGKSAEEMHTFSEQDPDTYEKYLQEPLLRQYIVRVRVKQDSWNDETRLRYQIQKIEPVNFVTESRLILDEIRQYEM